MRNPYMKFQDDISNMNTYIHTYIHTYIRTSRNQYVHHFFKVGGIKTYIVLIRINRGDEHPQYILYRFYESLKKKSTIIKYAPYLFFSMTDKCVLYDSAEGDNGRNIPNKKVLHTSVFRLILS